MKKDEVKIEAAQRMCLEDLTTLAMIMNFIMIIDSIFSLTFEPRELTPC